MRTPQKSRPMWVEALLARNLSPAEFRIWLYLAWRQGKNGLAWPAQQTLAADLGLTPEGVRKIIGRLATKGWLTVTRPAHTAPGVRLIYQIKHPNGCLGVSDNHPNRHTIITPTAIPPHNGRTHTGTKSEGRPRASHRKQSRRKFVPPAVADVASYAESIGYALDAEHFVDHYTSNGWMIGKNQMRDWQATVRNWRRRDADGSGKTKPAVIDDTLTEAEIVAKARAGGSKLTWLTGESADV